MKYIGAHVSASGGLANAPMNAKAIGATAFAMFTKNQRQWMAKEIAPDEAKAFENALSQSEIKPEHVLPHDSYIINLGAKNPDLLQKSRQSFTEELRRCERLGLGMLNFHPGSAKDWSSVCDCLNTVAQSINMALAETQSAVAVIENTAGQGSYLGSSFEEIRYLIDRIDQKERVGVCIDTCHALAAGYDLTGKDQSRRVWDEFGQKIGFQYLRGMHLNDSMKDLGSHVDRHESLGKGCIGLGAFETIMTDERFDNIPLVLETPNPDLWAEEITLLRSLAN